MKALYGPWMHVKFKRNRRNSRHLNKSQNAEIKNQNPVSEFQPTVGIPENNSSQVHMPSAELPSSNKFKLLSHVFAEELTRLDAEVISKPEPVKQIKFHDKATDIEAKVVEGRIHVSDLSKELIVADACPVHLEDGEFVPKADNFYVIEKGLDANSTHQIELYGNKVSIENPLKSSAVSFSPEEGIIVSNCNKDLSKPDENIVEVEKENNAVNDFGGTIVEGFVKSIPASENGKFVAVPSLACKENAKDNEGFIEGEKKIHLSSKHVQNKKKLNKDLNLLGPIKGSLRGRKLGVLGESDGGTSPFISK
ncbi:hypothetical protein MA16_Dca008401 [Dendrobium catenatum]|uniref:Uncharacterized protein n=1 Tax=Dendrobium catenatum TaxID=906689 RepID=A0A2I0VM28_9ASPA|nr:hypothetical protein MA16_Dca008401 [Dendrobium catenatum]